MKSSLALLALSLGLLGSAHACSFHVASPCPAGPGLGDLDVPALGLRLYEDVGRLVMPGVLPSRQVFRRFRREASSHVVDVHVRRVLHNIHTLRLAAFQALSGRVPIVPQVLLAGTWLGGLATGNASLLAQQSSSSRNAPSSPALPEPQEAPTVPGVNRNVAFRTLLQPYAAGVSDLRFSARYWAGANWGLSFSGSKNASAYAPGDEMHIGVFSRF